MDAAVMAVMRLSLIQACVRLSAEAGHTHFIGVMERSLLRLLGATGLHLQSVGPLVNYHGWRQPAYCDWDVALCRMAHESPEIWDFVTAGGKWWSNPSVDDAERLAA